MQMSSAMTEGKLRVPVHNLCKGLYVVELDRPWLGTPFLFQGFRIESDEELSTLQSWCKEVFVDPVRSDAEALAEAQKGIQPPSVQSQNRLPPTGHGRPSLAERDRVDAFGDSAFPDREKFREMVRVAHEARSQARDAVHSAMDDTRLGHAVDVPALRNAVSKMTQSVIGNASAALWLTALKNISEYTAIHCINVCVLSLAFGRHLGLPVRELRSIGLGSLLHDVGKAKTPSEILDKPGALTEEEFEIIKRHPEDGYRMVSEAGHVSPQALDIIRLHHERINGGGYPLDLSGDQISRYVRIVSIADVYDAMTTNRSYQDAKSPDTALKVLYEGRGRAFDDELVTQFIRCIGIFPVGSLVELDTGAIGLVVASSTNAHLQPTVLMLRTPDGEPYEKRLLINLAQLEDDDRARVGHRIVRGLDATSTGIDIASIAQKEFGLDELVN